MPVSMLKNPTGICPWLSETNKISIALDPDAMFQSFKTNGYSYWIMMAFAIGDLFSYRRVEHGCDP